MPSFPVVIEDTHASITRPVAINIIEDLKRYTNMDLSTEVQYIGSAARPIQPGSEITNSEIQRSQADNTYPSRGLVRIEVNEETVLSQILAGAVIRNDQRFIFHDKPLDIILRPAYAETEMVITLTARFPSKIAAEKWRDGIRVRASMGREALPHEITYNYHIPGVVSVILHGLHHYREATDGYGENLAVWLGNCLNKRATVLVNQAGNNHSLVMTETQSNVVGWFDFEGKPNPGEKDQNHGTWELSFDYKIRYQKVEAIVMSYPLMIHNTILPPELSPRDVPYQLQQNANRASMTQSAYMNLEKQRMANPGSGLAGITVPFFDDWYPESKSPATSPLIRFALELDPADKQDILSLTNLGDYEMDADIIAYMKDDYGRLGLTMGAGIRVTLYRKRIPMSDQFVVIDEDLNVRSSEPLSLREAYHVVISITTDLMAIPDAAKGILCKHGIACLKIMKALCPTLERVGLLPRLLSNNSISRQSYIKAASYINEVFTRDYPTRKGNWVLVSNIVIYTQGIQDANS